MVVRLRQWVTCAAGILAGVVLCACGGESETAPEGGSGAGAGVSRIVTVNSDLADLAKRIAGADGAVDSLLGPGKDPHEVDVRPDMARLVKNADVLIVVGRGNEARWLDDLLRLAGRADLEPGAANHIDASEGLETAASGEGADPGAAEAAEVSSGDAGHGEHPEGDPHYLLDPVQGLAAARHIRDRLSAIRPESAAGFSERYAAFEGQLLGKLVGPELAGAMNRVELIELLESDRLESVVSERKQLPTIGGWLGAMRPHRGAKFIGDHEVWDAFAARFGLVAAGYLEPAPGLDPTTQHLTGLTGMIRAEGVPLILTCSHVPQRHARFLTEQTPIQLLLLSDQVGEEAEAGDYLSLFDYNIGRITGALRPAPVGAAAGNE